MKEKVIEILVDLFECPELREDADVDLFEAGLLDSLGIVSLLIELESAFGVRLQPTDVERKDLSTADAIVSLLQKKGA